jgi:hypothetical protein
VIITGVIKGERQITFTEIMERGKKRLRRGRDGNKNNKETFLKVIGW